MKRCEYCGVFYNSIRNTGKYCSASCKTMACRKRKRTPPPDADEESSEEKTGSINQENLELIISISISIDSQNSSEGSYHYTGPLIFQKMKDPSIKTLIRIKNTSDSEKKSVFKANARWARFFRYISNAIKLYN